MQFNEIGRRLGHVALDAWRRRRRALGCAGSQDFPGVDQSRRRQGGPVVRRDLDVRIADFAGAHGHGLAVDPEVPGRRAGGRNVRRRRRETLTDTEFPTRLAAGRDKILQDPARLVDPGGAREGQLHVGDT